MFLMMKSSSSGCTNPNINNNRDLQPAVLTPKLTSTSSSIQNPQLALNHLHHQMVRGISTSEQGRSSSGCFCIDGQPSVAAAARSRRSRWTPAPEQVMALKEMYRRGLKTPTAKQIQLVTAQLRYFGRIESKNVFYWFQNHRARERQKRRRELMSMYQSTNGSKQQQTFTNNTTSGDLQNQESAEGLAKSSLEVEQQSSLEVEQQNKWKLPNTTVISDQESSSVLQERMMMNMVERNSFRQLVEQSASPRPATSDDTTLIHGRLLDYHHHDLTVPTVYRREEENRETRTLELFPLKSDNVKGSKDTKSPLIIRTTSTVNTTDSIADQIISVFERIKAAYNN